MTSGRNRTLHTTLGRWNQPDPNATGLAVQTSIGYHGVAPAARVQPFSLAAHFTDGPNVYAYLDNSPWTRSDPTGLFFGIVGSAMSAGFNAWDSASATLETAAIGLRSGFGLASMVSDYMTMQSDDVIWAGDWGFHDADNYISGVAFEGYGFTSVTDAALVGGEYAVAGRSIYHRKSRDSRVPNLGYVIEKFNRHTGRWEVQKYGISSQGLDSQGRSKREVAQMRAWRKADGGEYRTSKLADFDRRRKAMEWERSMVDVYGAEFGRNPPRQRRPKWR